MRETVLETRAGQIVPAGDTMITMATVETRSPFPSTASMCADRGEDVGKDGRADRATHQASLRKERNRARVLAKPKPFDGILTGTCHRCGIRGKHSTPTACIEALRDRLADVTAR
jgi:hypothetical protein